MITAFLRQWWRERTCRKQWHDFDDWRPLHPQLHKGRAQKAIAGPYLEACICQRCGFQDVQWVENVVIALNGSMRSHRLTGNPLPSRIRVPVVEGKVEVGSGPIRFGTRDYLRSEDRDAQGRAVFR